MEALSEPHNPGLYCYGNPLSAEARHRMTGSRNIETRPALLSQASQHKRPADGSISQSGLPFASLDVSVGITDPPCVVTIALTLN